MRERRGPLGRTVGAVADIVTAARGQKPGAEPRVLVYDAAGHSRLLRSGTPEHEALAETAHALIGVVREAQPPAADADAPEAE